jgi:16S rRNA (guanine527-N7)-methyltransferase
MAESNFKERLDAAAQRLGLALTAGQNEALLTYLAQLQRWNRTYNLTALRDPEQMLVQHVFDSLTMVEPVKEIAARSATPLRIVDVGSGAGLPGVVLAIMNPDWHVYCIDAVEKKMAFVRQVASILGLKNLEAVHARVEQLPLYQADIVTSRAFSSLLDFATLAGRHVAACGVMLAMKGRQPDEEVLALAQQDEWVVERTDTLQVPELDAQRCLVRLVRQGSL